MPTWTDLVLPPRALTTLRQIAADGRARVAAKGMVVLFTGASDGSKTRAAEVLASELQRPLHRIDLSKVASRYIGETEKGLELLFDKAQAGNAILLFDEADALFGKRSEVKDSHDRYANIEVGYLLQRMESHRGITILDTIDRSAIDSAVLRRTKYVVDFPRPTQTSVRR